MKLNIFAFCCLAVQLSVSERNFLDQIEIISYYICVWLYIYIILYIIIYPYIYIFCSSLIFLTTSFWFQLHADLVQLPFQINKHWKSTMWSLFILVCPLCVFLYVSYQIRVLAKTASSLSNPQWIWFLVAQNT